jgi:hypothetical protein
MIFDALFISKRSFRELYTIALIRKEVGRIIIFAGLDADGNSSGSRFIHPAR